MFDGLQKIGRYNVLIDANKLGRPLMDKSWEAKVVRIYDLIEQKDIPITSVNTCLSWGKTDKEAYALALARIKGWILDKDSPSTAK